MFIIKYNVEQVEKISNLCNGAGKIKKARCTPSTSTRKLHHQAFLKLSGVDVKVIVGKTNVHAEDIILSVLLCAKNAVVFPVSIDKRL